MAAPAKSQPSSRKRLSAEDRRAAILDSALEVFGKRGYHAASIDEIAQAAGISKALIYEHFPSKKELHVSLLERHVGEILRRLSRVADTSEPGDIRLRAGVDAFLDWVETHPGAFRLLFRDSLEAEVAEVLVRVQAQATGAIAALMASEPVERIPEEDPQEARLAIEVFAQQLSGSVQFLALWWEQHPDVPREFLVNRVMDYAWLGLERVRAGQRTSD